jgi:signal transduction histidine kinase
MSQAVPSSHRHRRTDLYGAGAFVCVVLTCFSQFAFTNRISGSVTQVAVTFGLGAIYTVVAILGHCFDDRMKSQWETTRFLIQCVVVTVMIFVSPVLGYFNIIILPLVSQAYFDFKWPAAVTATAYLFGVTIGVFVYRFGARAIPEAALNYVAAFAFTIAFTLLTRQALLAKEQAETLQHELETANAQLRTQASQAEDLATTRERNRVAREIHDGVGHYLTVVKTQLDAAAAILPGQPDRARESILKAAKLTGDALDDVRRSVGALRTDTARPPLPESLQTLVLDAGLPVTLRLAGATRPLAPGLEHALFRSAQEGLTNIRKHAAATAAELALDFTTAGRVTLTVTDNGRGTNGTAAAGFGLIGIRERIEILGGRVEAGNRPGGGFALNIEVPA